MGTTSAGSACALVSIRVKLIARGDKCSTVHRFSVAFERSMMAEGRQSKADKRVSGGKVTLYRCPGTLLPALFRSCLLSCSGSLGSGRSICRLHYLSYIWVNLYIFDNVSRRPIILTKPIIPLAVVVRPRKRGWMYSSCSIDEVNILSFVNGGLGQNTVSYGMVACFLMMNKVFAHVYPVDGLQNTRWC